MKSKKFFFRYGSKYFQNILIQKYQGNITIGTGLIKYLRVWNMIQELDPYDIYVCPVTKHSYTLNCV